MVHAAFMGVGAYTTILLIPHAAGREGNINEEGLPLFLAILIGLVASAIFWINNRTSCDKITR